MKSEKLMKIINAALSVELAHLQVLNTLAEAAPFHDHKVNSVTLLSWVIMRLWTVMNEGSSFDARSRLRALEFFETILPPPEEEQQQRASASMVTKMTVKDTTQSMTLKIPTAKPTLKVSLEPT